MSQENVEVVMCFFQAIDRALTSYWEAPGSVAEAVEASDLTPSGAAMFSYVHPQLEWKLAFAGMTAHGHVGMARAIDDFLEEAEHYSVTLRQVEDLGGDRVLATVDRAATSKRTVMEINAAVFALITVRDGLIVRMEEFAQRREALGAVGLRE